MRMQAAEAVDTLKRYAAMSNSRRATSITLALALERVVVDQVGQRSRRAQNRRGRNRVQCQLQLQLPFTTATATSAPAVVMSCARPDRASSCSLPTSVPLRSTVVFAFSRFLPLWAGTGCTFAPRVVTSQYRAKLSSSTVMLGLSSNRGFTPAFYSKQAALSRTCTTMFFCSV